MKKFSELKDSLEVKSEFELIIGDKKLIIPLKSLPANFDDELDTMFPLPTPPKRPDKRTHQILPDLTDEKYLEKRKKMEKLRTYATVAFALCGPIQVAEKKKTTSGADAWTAPEAYELEGDIYAKIDQLLDSKIGIGYWIQVAEEVQNISGLDMDRFRERLPEIRG
jgi:hypothetical protein